MKAMKVVSRYVDEDGCTRELVAVRGSNGKVRMRERYAKSRFHNRGWSSCVGVIREGLEALFSPRLDWASTLRGVEACEASHDA